jgi:hypothetical protein
VPLMDWLVGEFMILGIHFQNWMPIAAAIGIAGILWAWVRRSA